MQLRQWDATARHRFGTSRQTLRAAGRLAGIVHLALCAMIMLTGCTERGAHIQGTSGPVAWQVTALRVVEREVAGAPRDLYAFTLVLTETQGATLTFTYVERTISPPGVNTAGVTAPFAIRWPLRPHGEWRHPFSSFWSCTGADCGFWRSIPPAPWYTLVLTGTDARRQPVRVAIDCRLPQHPPRLTFAQSKETPAASPPSTASGAVRDSGPVPFQTVDNHVLVSAVLKQKEHATLLVDTGATSTFLTPATAKRLGVRPTADAPRRTTTVVGGRQGAFPLVQLATMAVGEAVMDNLQVGGGASFPNAPLVDGILGGSLLTHCTMTLADATSRLRLVPRATLPPPPPTPPVVPAARRSAVPIHLVGHQALVRAVLHHTEQVTRLLDTGAMSTLLTPNTAQRLGISPAADAPRRIIRVADGQLQAVPFVPLSALTVGEAMVESLQVGLSVLFPRAPAVAGLLGGDFLERFKMTLDRTTRQLWLEPYQTVRP